MRRVILYGELAKKFGKEHRLRVRSAAEAIQALCANFKEFRSHMSRAHLRGVGFRVLVGKEQMESARHTTQPTPMTDTIRIIPAVFGGGPAIRILAGAALIVAGALLLPAGGVSTAMIGTGISLTLGGVIELLSPTPKLLSGLDSLEDTQNSFIFSGPENISRQGVPVPVGYGRVGVGSIVISAGIEGAEYGY